MNIISTNFHVPYLHLLSKIPNTQFFVFSFRFMGRDWQNQYRLKPSNVLHMPVDDPKVIGFLLPSLLQCKIDLMIFHSLSDFEIFCNPKNMNPEIYEVVQRIPKIMVFHNSIYTEMGNVPKQFWQEKVNQIIQVMNNNNIKAVCISKFKAESWQLPCNIILPGIDLTEFTKSWTGLNNSLLINNKFPDYSVRVCSNFEYRDFMNGYRISSQVLSGIKHPNIVLGEGNQNTKEKIPQAIFAISQSLEHYKQVLSQSRFMMGSNIADFEDWYNLSLLEGIALGVPMMFLYHERTDAIPEFTKYFPVISDDVAYLQERGNELFKDLDFAGYISEKSRGFIEKYFSLSVFLNNWQALMTQSTKIEPKISNN